MSNLEIETTPENNCPYMHGCTKAKYPCLCEESHEMCYFHNGWVSHDKMVNEQNE